MKTTVLFLISVLLGTAYAPKTTTIEKNYDLFVGKNKIGWFKISKTTSGDKIRYQASSDATFSVLFTNNIAYTLDCIVEKGILTYSHCTVRKNDKIKDDTEIRWLGSHYQIIKEGQKSIHEGPIDSPAISLYFEEPQANSVKVFSEREAGFKEFTRQAEHQYKLTPVGKNSGDDYTYKDGELREVIVSYVVTNFRTVLRK